MRDPSRTTHIIQVWRNLLGNERRLIEDELCCGKQEGLILRVEGQRRGGALTLMATFTDEDARLTTCKRIAVRREVLRRELARRGRV